jgi:hypothetical protein
MHLEHLERGLKILPKRVSKPPMPQVVCDGRVMLPVAGPQPEAVQLQIRRLDLLKQKLPTLAPPPLLGRTARPLLEERAPLAVLAVADWPHAAILAGAAKLSLHRQH